MDMGGEQERHCEALAIQRELEYLMERVRRDPAFAMTAYLLSVVLEEVSAMARDLEQRLPGVEVPKD